MSTLQPLHVVLNQTIVLLYGLKLGLNLRYG